MTIEEVKNALIEAGEKDQAIIMEIDEKGETPELVEKSEKINEQNNELIKRIVAEHGLITISKYGKKASLYAFLLVQHCNKEDLPFMESYLEKMKNDLNDVSLEHYALLQDRVLVYQGKKQLYGTQLFFNENTGKHESRPVEDPANLNKRRKDLGLTTIEEYLSPD